MDFTHEFRVNLPPDAAWDLLTDVERVAPCMPGAQLTGVDGDAYNGVVKIKVGPMTVQYKGVVSFEEKDAQGRTAVLRARGRDTRGQGNADARVTARLVPDAAGTAVTVDTRLTVTGRIAQFGRGMIEEVSGRLLAQFVDNLEDRLAAERRGERAEETSAETSAGGAAEVPVEGDRPAPAPGVSAAGPVARTTAGAAAGPATGDGPGPAIGDGPGPAAGPRTAPDTATGPRGTVPQGAEPEPEPPTAPRKAVAGDRRTPADPVTPAAQPLDLMSVARGAVLKRALPAVLVLAVLVVVLVLWLAR
ncbi:SRPBCC family protein [Streptomyces apricus]|uniref:Carbon monoxide dehydrogenase n=1 Tax=Streptomyces apricus TaxID=1828112 RepID=A0A5B0AGT7_9ACTN|nr:SRPBCC family protein [Streptomyces apricus]KAA0929050.1 carbon monoxide dehydrogenase [Streptomyces apricus]